MRLTGMPRPPPRARRCSRRPRRCRRGAPGASAETVWPLSLVRNHAPLSEHTTPGPHGVGDLAAAGAPRRGRSRPAPVMPSASPRARASSGCISSGGVAVAGGEAAEGRGDALVGGGRDQGQRVGRVEGPVARAAARRTSARDSSTTSSTLPDGVFGRTLPKSTASSPPTVMASGAVRGHAARPHARRAAGRPGRPRRPSARRRWRVKIGSVEAEARGEPAEDLGVGQATRPGGGITGSARCSQCWP